MSWIETFALSLGLLVVMTLLVAAIASISCWAYALLLDRMR